MPFSFNCHSDGIPPPWGAGGGCYIIHNVFIFILLHLHHGFYDLSFSSFRGSHLLNISYILSISTCLRTSAASLSYCSSL